MSPPTERHRDRPLCREEFETLKLLAARGGRDGPVLLTSQELGELLQVSQQAASNYLVDLTARHLVQRTPAGRRQELRLTGAGSRLLEGELLELRRLLEEHRPLEIRGTVVSGLGEGRYYLSIAGYVAQFRERLGYTPFPGTLNVKLGPEEIPRLREVRALAGIRIDGFQDQGRTFGGATCYPSRLGTERCHLILPDRTHYTDVAELIAPVELRRALRLKDQDPVQVQVGTEGPAAPGRRPRARTRAHRGHEGP